MGFMAAQVAPTWCVSDRLRGCLLTSVTSNSREPDVGDVDERSQDAVLEELVIAAVSAEECD